MNLFHFNILDSKRQALLPFFTTFSEDGFYLAGGTGLALQLGHRDSIDFDFFKEGDFSTHDLQKKIESIFSGHAILITQEEKNTLSCIIDKTIRISFFGIPYPLQKLALQTEFFAIASLEDIGCMKLAAITSRALEKDYIDTYFILQIVTLRDLIDLCRVKYPTLDAVLILKSLVYFEDVLHEQIVFKEKHEVAFEVVKEFLRETVARYLVG